MSSESYPPNSHSASPQQTDKIRVLIVDDHAVVRQGLRTFLELQDEATSLPIIVVGEASNGSQAVDQARLLQPDVVLLDLVMPEMDGVEATDFGSAFRAATRSPRFLSLESARTKNPPSSAPT